MSSIVDEFIQLENVSKVYRTADVETRALSNASLTILRGEYVAISGPSGSGKTTLLSLIGLLDTPTEGSYRFDEHDVLRLNRSRARANQKPADWLHLSVIQSHR